MACPHPARAASERVFTSPAKLITSDPEENPSLTEGKPPA